MEFIAVKQILLHHIDKFLLSPCSKSEIFTSNEIKLIEKQKLLNFIFAVMKIKNKVVDVNTTVEFKKDNEVDYQVYEDVMKNLNKSANEYLSTRFSPLLQKIIKVIMGNLDPNCDDENIILDSLCDNVYKYLNSLSVYGQTPFIIPLYGSSEFSQALSRMSSVFGTIYIVNDTLQIVCGVNNEYFIDNSNSYFILKIYDKNQDESFYVLTNNIICNENFLSVNSKFTFNKEISKNFVNSQICKKLQQFISFYVIENDSRLRSSSCPIIYKVPKFDEFFNNEYGYIAYEFDQTSCSAPKMRTVLQIMITSNTSEEESVFIEKSKIICDSFIKRHLENLSNEIKSVVSQPEKMDEDTKYYYDKLNNSDNLNLNVNLLATFQFYRNFSESIYEKVKHDTPGNIQITRNNYFSNDVDFYYEECEKILKNEKWENLESIEVKENFGDGNEIAETNENLIDEIFGLISEDKK